MLFMFSTKLPQQQDFSRASITFCSEVMAFYKPMQTEGSEARDVELATVSLTVLIILLFNIHIQLQGQWLWLWGSQFKN